MTENDSELDRASFLWFWKKRSKRTIKKWTHLYMRFLIGDVQLGQKFRGRAM